MAPFSGHHMKICFINHCCPMKQKSNHRWECALKVSYAWQLWSRVCSYPGKPNMSHPLGSCARTGRNLIGNFLLEAQGNAPHCTGAQCRPGALCFALRPEKQCIAWAVSSAAATGMGWAEGTNPISSLPVWPGPHSQRRTLLHCQYWLWHLPSNAHIDDVMQCLVVNYYFIIRDMGVV